MLPSRIGPSKIVRELGRGGMGVVYEGLHESIERRVALKVLRAEYVTSAQILTRFFNETAAQSHRRNIADSQPKGMARETIARQLRD